jgi:hypothetical protein
MNGKELALKEDTVFSTGYLGRGIPSKSRVFPAGSKYIYTKKVTRSGIYHTATIKAEGFIWEANRRVPLGAEGEDE